MRVYRLKIEAVIICDGGEGPPDHWAGDAIADSLSDDPSHGNRATWQITSCAEFKEEDHCRNGRGAENRGVS